MSMLLLSGNNRYTPINYNTYLTIFIFYPTPIYGGPGGRPSRMFARASRLFPRDGPLVLSPLANVPSHLTTVPSRRSPSTMRGFRYSVPLHEGLLTTVLLQRTSRHKLCGAWHELHVIGRDSNCACACVKWIKHDDEARACVALERYYW